MEKRTPLRRHPDLIPYSRTHHKVLIVAQLLKVDVPNFRGLPETPFGKRAYLLVFLDDLLEPHMQLEEQDLFPNAKKYEELKELVASLEDDHHFFRKEIPLLSMLDEAPLVHKMDEIGLRLERHVRTEERQFFQQYQSLCLQP